VTDSEDLICKEVSSGNLQSCTSVDGETVKIEATRGTIYLNNLDTNQDYIDSIPSIRKTLDDSDGNKLPGTNTEFDPKMIYAHGSVFLFWQQYVDIEDNLWMVVGFALLGVFGATFLFQFSPLTSLLVGVMLGATVLQLYGLMYAIGVKLNAFSLTNLAIAVGMAVEFTAHIAYAFLRAEAPSQDRDARVAYALSEMMQPMVSGAMTTFISVICLAFAKYPFFSLYYFEMISLMILMAFLNGMVFLPVILSLIGPSGMPDIGKMSVDYSQRSGAGKALEDSGL
jgi:predicted RND superfamily exporter protein